MKNFKHSIAAVIAIAMISSLGAKQAYDYKRSIDTTNNIVSAPESDGITIEAPEELTEDAAKDSETETEAQTEEEYIDPAELEAKSSLETGYVSLTSGTLNVRQSPSDESEIVGELNACDEVTVLNNSDGWYNVSYDGGKVGYVSADALTDDKSDAEYNAMYYDHYKKAIIQSFCDTVNVRADATTESSAIDTVEDGTPIVVLDGKDNFIKIAYGQDYTEGYVINTAVDFTGEWIEKDTVADRQREVAEAKAAAARAEEMARKNAASSGRFQNGSSSAPTQAPAASSKGQAIVNTAMQYQGVPYVWGGTSPSGFDCSGLVQYVCSKNGISIARVAADQRNCGTYVSRDNLQPGDLVFFGKGYIHHVGIYIGNGQMIHAPQTGDVVKVSSINTDYRISTYAGAVRVY